MKKAMNYFVIGGQYQSYCYGAVPTLAGAKRVATKHEEYWDNWNGWHTPVIYAASDVVKAENFYGEGYAPKCFAIPVAYKDEKTGRWVEL